MIAIIFLFGIAILLYYFITSSFNYWKNKSVPYPPVSYLFGNVGSAVLSKKSVQEVYDELYSKYSTLSYIGFYKMRTPCILLRDPSTIKEVMVKSFSSFADNDVFADEKIDPLFAKNPFVSRGHLWKKNRNELAPSFTAKRVKEMYPLIEAVSKNLVKYINFHVVGNDDGVDAKKLFVKYTTDVVTNCALGIEANSFTDPNSDSLKIFNMALSTDLFAKLKLLIMFNFPMLVKLFKLSFVPKEVDRYYRTITKNTMEYRKTNKIYRGDFLDSMIELKEKDVSNSFTDEDIAGNVMGFITEGTESSSIILSFTLYELALDTDVQVKLRNEVDEALQRCQGKLSYEAVQNMVYLDQVLNESMRKNTVAPLIRRLCTQAFHMESPDGKSPSVAIEPGTPMIIPVHSLHHDPKYYPNPEIFDPLRFSKESEEKRPSYSYMPFGEGPRICLGSRFGVTQIKVALAHIIANFEITINKKTVVPYIIDPQYFVLEAKDGIWLNMHKRKSP